MAEDNNAFNVPLGERKLDSMMSFVTSMFVVPAKFVREKIVEPNRGPEYPWYHRRYRRVPTIDQCYMEDIVCREEANHQYGRDKGVESMIVDLLHQRFQDCILYDFPDQNETGTCHRLKAAYDLAAKNWYIKYGDMASYHRVESSFMKQKHRMIWERRYGEVGTGMTPKEEGSQ